MEYTNCHITFSLSLFISPRWASDGNSNDLASGGPIIAAGILAVVPLVLTPDPFDREWMLADLSVHPARMLQHRSPVTAYGTLQPLAHDVARGLCSPADDKGRQGQRGTVQPGDAPALIEVIAKRPYPLGRAGL